MYDLFKWTPGIKRLNGLINSNKKPCFYSIFTLARIYFICLWPYAIVCISVSIPSSKTPPVHSFWWKPFLLAEVIVFIDFVVFKDDKVYSNTRVSTQVNTSQHESTRVRHESTRINTSPTQVNTNQHESDTSQHKSTRVRHESTRINKSLKQV